MIRILSEGDGRHRIDDGYDAIGWIRGQAIGFRGFASESDAREAAIAARHALDRLLRSHYPGWPDRSTIHDRLKSVHDGAYEWLFDGATAIARLLRPTRRAYDSSFGIELVLPSFASEGITVAAGHAISMAVAPYRIPPDPPEPPAARASGESPSAPDSSVFY